MKPNFFDLISKRIVLFDGGMGSLLIDAGLKSDECPELWNIENPEQIAEIHRSYYQAGADIILTNTFGGSTIKLKTKGLENRTQELNQAAVSIAKKVCPRDKYFAGDIGPTSKFLPPVGKFTEKDFYKAFSIQATALLESGVDLIVIETMYDLREAIQALNAVRDINSSIPVIVTMTFDKKKRGYFTIMGDTPQKCFMALEEAGANVVGANCTLTSQSMVELCKEIRPLTSLPLSIQPNAGQPIVTSAKVTYSQTPDEFATDMIKIIEAGANIVGGCCGTTPEFIAKTCRALGLMET